MALLDILILVTISGFTIYGFARGLIRSAGALAGLLLGVWGAMLFYTILFGWLNDLFLGHDILGKSICFLIIYIIINRLVNYGFSILDSTYDIISIVPFLRTINRVTGALLGFIEGGLAAGLVLYASLQLPLTLDLFAKMIIKSQFAPQLIIFAKIFLPLAADLFGQIRSTVDHFDMKKVYPEKFEPGSIKKVLPFQK